MLTLALKKEGVGLQSESLLGLLANRSSERLGFLVPATFCDEDHKDFLIDYEAERYTSRHLQIYLSI